MTEQPEHVIRRYLEDQGGEAEVPFHNLLTSWDIGEANPPRRVAIERSLGEAGISVEPPLAELDENDVVLLSVREPARGEPVPVAERSAPPWAGAAAPGAGTGNGDRQAGSRGRLAAAIAVFILLAVGVAGGGYALGKSGGEDLDAARAKGAAQGQREGAARGAERGYDVGLKQGEKAGYKQTYKKAYNRAYKKELKKAGLTPAQVSSK